MTLELLAKKYALDKYGYHGYIPGYESLFKDIKNDVMNVLEIGIGCAENGQMLHIISNGYKTGNSLRCWRDYFPNAMIYGIDIYDTPIQLRNEERIQTYIADQSSATQLNIVINKIKNNLDIIIDDGSHQFNHQVFSFMHLEKYLSKNGIYVIEDIQAQNIPAFQNLSMFTEEYKKYINENYIIKYFDTRTITRLQDDFMIAFIKK
jgi:hypothetical protein